MKTLRYCVALSATTLVLAGCGADAKPKFEAEPSPAPTSASPTPDKPEPWEEKSDEGAIAFVEHWIDVFNGARSGGETRDLQKLGTRACETCNNFIKLTNRIYEAGGVIRTTGWEIVSLSEPAVPDSENPMIAIRVDQAPQVLRESATTKPIRYSGGKADFAATLTWRNGRWLMDRLDIVT